MYPTRGSLNLIDNIHQTVRQCNNICIAPIGFVKPYRIKGCNIPTLLVVQR